MKPLTLDKIGQKVIDELRCSNCNKKFVDNDIIYPFHNNKLLEYKFEAGFTRLFVNKFYHTIQEESILYLCKECKI